MAETESRLTGKELMERTLRELPAFAAWSPVAMSRLLALSRLQWHARGDWLSSKANPPEILVLVSGNVMYAEPANNGIAASWTLLGPGLVLGLPHMLELEDRLFEYIANDDVVAIHIRGGPLFELLDSDPVRWKDLGHMIMWQDLKLGDVATSQMAGRLSRRLAETIEKLAASDGVRLGENGPIQLRLAQHDLAAVLRVSRQSVSKELADLAASGVIELKYNAILVLDPAALRNLARPSRAQRATASAPRLKAGESTRGGEATLMEETLRTKQIFFPWPAAAMTRLLRSSRLERHPSGSTVWTSLSGAADYIFFVSGHTTVGRVSPEGERSALMIFGPGDFSYITPLTTHDVPGDYGDYDFIAESDVVAIRMPMDLLLETLDNDPALWKEALLMSERQHESYTRTVYGQIKGSLRQRVASTVQRLAALHGTRAGSEAAVRVRVSQAGLATLLQANRQAVNKELKALAAAGAIELGYNAVTVLDPEALGRIGAS